jgi:hypothetical protein
LAKKEQNEFEIARKKRRKKFAAQRNRKIIGALLSLVILCAGIYFFIEEDVAGIIGDRIASSSSNGEGFPIDISGTNVLKTFTVGEHFGVLTDAVYFPRAHQAQFVLRYNNSALRYLAEDYSLPSVPEKGGEWFDLTLVVVYEYKASEDALPVEKELRLRPVSTVSESTSLYNYRQLTFEGLPELETVKNIYFDIYYIEDADYAKTPYSRIRALNGEMSLRDYTLDKKDIAALTKGGK